MLEKMRTETKFRVTGFHVLGTKFLFHDQGLTSILRYQLQIEWSCEKLVQYRAFPKSECQLNDIF